MSILFILCGTSRISLRRKEWALLEFLTLNFAQFCEDFHAAILSVCYTPHNNQKAFRLSLLGTGFQNRGLCQICLATDQVDNQGSVATSCAVQLHIPLCAVIVSLLTFTIA